MITSLKQTTKEIKTMKAKVTKILLKGGFNQASVDHMIAEHFDYAVRTYPEAKPSFIADVVSSLS